MAGKKEANRGRTSAVLAILVAVIVWPTASFAADVLTIASREHTLTNRFAEQVLEKAYAQLGIDAQFVNFPGARSVIEANEGRADGEVARLEVVLGKYKNLRLVPVPLFYSELTVFARQDSHADKVDHIKWDDLKDHSVATVRGFKLVEDKIKNLPHRLTVTTADAIKLVAIGAVELAVLNRFLGELAVASEGTKNVKRQAASLERLPAYHLLHKKHEALVPRLTAVLEAMEQDGTLRAMWQDFTAREIQKVMK